MSKLLYFMVLGLMVLFVVGCAVFSPRHYWYAISFISWDGIEINKVTGIIEDRDTTALITPGGTIFPYLHLPEKQVTVKWTKKESGKRYVKTVEVNPPKEFTRKYGMTIYFIIDNDNLFVAYEYAYNNNGICPKNRYKLPCKAVFNDGTEFDDIEHHNMRRSGKIKSIEEYKNWKKSQVAQ